MAYRAFISVDIGPLDGLVSLSDELRSQGAQLRLVDPSIMHLTLRFMGDIDESMTVDIVGAIERSVDGVGPFTIRLHGTGAFPSIDRIRVVWVGVEDAGPLGAIAHRLEGALGELGLKGDGKGFRPHLTVGRSKGTRGMDRVRDVLERRRDDPFGDVRVTAVRLKSSVLGPHGPTYSTVAEVPL